MKTPSEILSVADVERVHGNANFGDMTKREVVNEGVLKYAFGYTSGHTQMTILQEHGLITKRSSLTEKGREYLRAMFRDVPLSEILRLSK